MKLTELQHIPKKEYENILFWLREFKIGMPNYYIHTDTGIVDVYQSVVIQYRDFDTLPIQFGILDGCFTIIFCRNLTSLKGCPPIVNYSFNCVSNISLTSAVDGPQKVGADATYKGCPLTSFEGFAKEIDKDLSINDLKINTFSGINKHIKSIKGQLILGADCYKYHKGMMGLMLIRNLKKIESTPLSNYTPQHEAIKIINKHLREDRSGPSCQLELIDAGFEEYAKL